MLNRLFASTAIAALIASGAAYAQTTETEEGQVQAEQQDRIAPAMGQEISVRDGDTVTLESADVEFTVRVSSSETSAVPGDDLAGEPEATEDMAAADSGDMAADDSAAAIDSASDTGGEAAESTAGTTATDNMASDAGMAGQDRMVSNGDILVIASEGENFQLNFEIGEDGTMAAMDGTDSTATTGSIATDGSAISSVDRDDLQARALDQIRADDLIGSTVYGSAMSRSATSVMSFCLRTARLMRSSSMWAASWGLARAK